jgi:hypothetical protein
MSDEKTPERPNKLQVLTALATAASLVLIPLVLAFVGNKYSNATKEKEIRARFLELAVGILNKPDSTGDPEIRRWAVKVIDRYSEVPFSDSARTLLVGGASIASSGPRIETIGPRPTRCTIPPDVTFNKEGNIRLSSPPSEFRGANAWLIAIHDTRLPELSLVEIDYLRLFVRIEGKDILVASNEYDGSPGGGMLFSRQPWFGAVKNREFQVAQLPGSVIIHPSRFPDELYHLWIASSPSNPQIPAGADLLWMEARVRIEGPALVQGGIDFYRDVRPPDLIAEPGSMREGGASHWFCAAPDWQVVSLGKPES